VQYSYLVVDNDEENGKETSKKINEFSEFYCIGTAIDTIEAVNKVLEFHPQLVFLTLGDNSKPNKSFALIAQLNQYLNILPYFICIADNQEFAFDAIKFGVLDYLLRPLEEPELRKCLFRFKKKIADSGYTNNAVNLQTAFLNVSNQMQLNESDFDRTDAGLQKNEVDIQICIKSYGDYQFIALKDVVYLKADNNTTDFHMQNGKKLTAYKTLKHYENNLPSFFYRIHNSYIVNSNYVSRINTGKLLCYLDNNEISVSFSKTFKENIDTIIRKIAPEYL
jgi:two-component system LytT family response regulator